MNKQFLSDLLSAKTSFKSTGGWSSWTFIEIGIVKPKVLTLTPPNIHVKNAILPLPAMSH